MIKIRFLFLTSLVFAAGQPPMSWGAEWVPNVVQLGDHKANYLNVEITADNKYMIWFEGLQGSSTGGVVWRCMIDQQTGELIPADCRGIRALDAQPPYHHIWP